MPQETFFNLEVEKRERIITAAIREFSHKGYQGATIESIAAAARVAKGSMYQYFAGKEDVLTYLVDLVIGKETDALAESVVKQGHLPFFAALEATWIQMVELAEADPDLFRVCRVVEEGAPDCIRDPFEETVRGLWNQYYQSLLARAGEEGIIRSAVSIDLASFVVSTLVRRSLELLATEELPQEQREVYLKEGIAIIKHGLGRNS